MNFIKLISSQQGSYSYRKASNIEMEILGHFLTSDVRCGSSGFKEWALNDSWGDECSGNTTALEKEDNYILLSELYSEEENPTILKMTKEQFVQIITDWKEKTCKLKPKEVTITYENDQFIIETKD